eukprot:3970517-Prymnesium_polylepis.2
MPDARATLPHAPCLMPHATCLMPHAATAATAATVATAASCTLHAARSDDPRVALRGRGRGAPSKAIPTRCAHRAGAQPWTRCDATSLALTLPALCGRAQTSCGARAREREEADSRGE